MDDIGLQIKELFAETGAVMPFYQRQRYIELAKPIIEETMAATSV